MILVTISTPSLTWVPCTTDPGGDWAMLTPITMGSAAMLAAVPSASMAAQEAAMRRGSFMVDFSFKNGMRRLRRQSWLNELRDASTPAAVVVLSRRVGPGRGNADGGGAGGSVGWVLGGARAWR